MKIMPLPERVVVQVHPVEDMSPGGIIIPETAEDRRRSFNATVLGVGPGRLLPDGKRRKRHVRQGDVVVIPRNAARLELRAGGNLIQILEHDEILAVYRRDGEVEPDEFVSDESLTSMAYVVREGDDLDALLAASGASRADLLALNTPLDWTVGVEVTVPRALGLYLIAREAG